MSTPLIVKDTHPRKDFASTVQLGLKALELATKHDKQLTERLPEGMVSALADDLDAVGVVVPGAQLARNDAMDATVAQSDTLEASFERVRAMRASIRKSKAARSVQVAYGVGRDADPRVVSDVKVAIETIIKRATANPTEAASLGILKQDVDALKTSLAAITTTNSTQEKKRANAPLSTKERNRTVNRILAAVARIEGAGRIAFADAPETRVSFEALGAGPRRSKKASAKPKAKADAKPEAKADAKPEVKPEAKADAEPEAKADAKPEPQAPASARVEAPAKASASPEAQASA